MQTKTDTLFQLKEIKDYYFTFTQGSELKNHYIVFHGTFSSTRDRMVAIFGSSWAFQYSSRESAGVDRYNLKQRHTAKLNTEAVKVIKWMLKYKPERGLASKLARLHGVGRSVISSIQNEKIWTSVKV